MEVEGGFTCPCPLNFVKTIKGLTPAELLIMPIANHGCITSEEMKF